LVGFNILILIFRKNCEDRCDPELLCSVVHNDRELDCVEVRSLSPTLLPELCLAGENVSLEVLQLLNPFEVFDET
jgi:hypothetical protein